MTHLHESYVAGLELKLANSVVLLTGPASQFYGFK